MFYIAIGIPNRVSSCELHSRFWIQMEMIALEYPVYEYQRVYTWNINNIINIYIYDKYINIRRGFIFDFMFWWSYDSNRNMISSSGHVDVDVYVL